MIPIRVIILAAGQGSRLGPIAAGRPKCLMPVVGSEPLLRRTVRQLHQHGIVDVTIVVGYEHQQIREAMRAENGSVRFVLNERFASDTNIGSLLMGIGGELARPTLVIEADIAFHDDAVASLVAAGSAPDSVWFTRGAFLPGQMGGILRSDKSGALTDLRYVREWEPCFKEYKKLVGAVHVGMQQLPRFWRLLAAAAEQTTTQYYMEPWCRHLSSLPAREVDLGADRSSTFNTPADYAGCCALFNSTAASQTVSL